MAGPRPTVHSPIRGIYKSPLTACSSKLHDTEPVPPAQVRCPRLTETPGLPPVVYPETS